MASIIRNEIRKQNLLEVQGNALRNLVGTGCRQLLGSDDNISHPNGQIRLAFDVAVKKIERAFCEVFPLGQALQKREGRGVD